MTSDLIKSACDKMMNVCESLIAYEHSEKADNIHVHLLLLKCQVSTDTLKNYIKSSGPVPPRAGNKFWSFKTCDNDLKTPITYMSKGKLDPFIVKGFTQEEINDCKDRWVARAPETSRQGQIQFVVKETPAEAKKRKNDLINEMLEDKTIHSTESIVRRIVTVLNKNNVIFGRYTVRDYFDTIMARSHTKTFINAMENFVGYRI